MITHPCLNFKNSFAKLSLKLGMINRTFSLSSYDYLYMP